MTVLAKGMGVLLLVAVGGCAAPIARALPLEPVTHWTTPPAPKPIVDVTSDGLTVVGSNGDALTAATRIHQRLRALKISNEIRCKVVARPKDDRTRLHITFPDGPLSAEQQQLVQEVLRQLEHSSSVSILTGAQRTS